MKTTRRATRKWTRNRKKVPVASRLQAKLKPGLDGCIEFTGYRNRAGYGEISVGGRSGRAELTHRVAWELANGPIPDGMFVCHHCDNPSCAQTEPTEGYPDGHLFLGTNADNMADMVAKRRHWAHDRTHCRQGHLYDEANTCINSVTGYRFCRECRLIWKRSVTAAKEDTAC